MNKETKAELVAQAIIGYIFLLMMTFIIYLIFSCLVDLEIFGKQADQSTILTNLFIWSATLYTPFLAYMAYSSWKEQKKYDIENYELQQILKYLDTTFSQLVILRSNINNIKDTNKNFSYYPSIINKKDLNISEILTKIYSHINTYCIISENKDLIELYHMLDNYLNYSFTSYRDLNYLYNEYVYIIEKNLLNIRPYDYSTNYNKHTNKELTHKIREIEVEINKKIDLYTFDKDNNETYSAKLNIIEIIEKTIELNEEFKIFCVKKIVNPLSLS